MPKYSLDEKRNIMKEWFTNDNMIMHPLIGLIRFNSKVDEDVLTNRKPTFELLELDETDLIRFAVGFPGDCTCKSAALDYDDVINLKNLLDDYIRSKND